LGCGTLDSSVDRVPLGDDDPDDRAGELSRRRVRLGLRELPLQDRGGRALAELRLEHRRERDASARSL